MVQMTGTYTRYINTLLWFVKALNTHFLFVRVSEENYEEVLKALNVGFMLRKVILASVWSPVLILCSHWSGRPSLHPHHDHHRVRGPVEHGHQDHHEEHRPQVQVNIVRAGEECCWVLYCSVQMISKMSTSQWIHIEYTKQNFTDDVQSVAITNKKLQTRV